MKFNENTRVKIPATVHFTRLGYKYQSLKDSEIDSETKIFINRFKPSIEKLNNRIFSDQEITSLISSIHNVLKNNDLGKEFYKWLINSEDNIRLIDFDNILNNDFSIVTELSFGDPEKGSFRPDISILINGIPLGFLEVKKPNNEGGIQAEFNRMINLRLANEDYKKYFNMIQFVAFSNNMPYEDGNDSAEAEDIKAGSFYTTPNGKLTSFSHFREEEKNFVSFEPITTEFVQYILKDNGYSQSDFDNKEFSDNLSLDTPCNQFITSLFSKARIMYFVRFGIMYVEESIPQKHIMRYPQFFASQEIVKRLSLGIQRGIIWHTQGSGKTALAAYSNQVMQNFYSKKNILTRFYFIVDRLDLLNQASSEFKKRGFHVTNVNSKEEFQQELSKPLNIVYSMDSIGEFTVVNIQKFSDELSEIENHYDANVQRIFFIDEAHRSYKNSGEFFRNLMLVDENAIFIALTGTPLLSRLERSNLKFGDYIHKYFYDKSILDGYTLRIKKEYIEQVEKTEIRKNLEFEDQNIDKKIVFESDNYISSISRFIDSDFTNFRFVNTDSTIGGMIVCTSNLQAKKIHGWFKKNSELKTGLVITDQEISTQANLTTQTDFKESFTPDLLIVHLMLTTGYDVKRLKKMYLLRSAKEHSLLQTISRVNRPYRSNEGKVYQYGYIVDFVDITEEYDRTIDAYVKELESGLGEDAYENSLVGLVIGPDDIYAKYMNYMLRVSDIIETDNVEKFSRDLSLLPKETLLYLKRLMNGIKYCYSEFLLSKAKDYARKIDIDHLKKLLKALQNRIDFINLKSQPTDFLSIISNTEIVEILFEFIKTKVVIMNLGSLVSEDGSNPKITAIEGVIKDLQTEIKRNRNRNQFDLIKLDEILRRLFEMLDISRLDDLDVINSELFQALQEIRRINDENARLSMSYNGNYAFVKSYTDVREQFPSFDSVKVEHFIKVIFEKYSELVRINELTLQGRLNFTNSIKKLATVELLKDGTYKELNLSEWFTTFLNELYTNIKTFN